MEKRIYTVKDKNYSINEPTDLDLEQSDSIYARKMAELINDARDPKKKKTILFRSQLNDFMREQGLWTDKDDKELLALRIDYVKTQEDLEAGGVSVSEGRKYAIKMFELTRKITEKGARQRTFDDTTAEGVAEDEQRQYLAWATSSDESNGLPIWQTFEDFKQDKSSELYRETIKNYYIFSSGGQENFIESQPEVQWLKKYGYITKDLKLIDRKTKEPVDMDGNPVEIQEEDDKKTKPKPFIDDETGKPIRIK